MFCIVEKWNKNEIIPHNSCNQDAIVIQIKCILPSWMLTKNIFIRKLWFCPFILNSFDGLHQLQVKHMLLTDILISSGFRTLNHCESLFQLESRNLANMCNWRSKVFIISIANWGNKPVICFFYILIGVNIQYPKITSINIFLDIN